MSERFYIDCEFDGHGGPLLSIALVHEGGCSIHVQTDQRPRDPWVAQNVMPIMDAHNAATESVDVPLNSVGRILRDWLGNAGEPVFIADSPVDIGRICEVLSTNDSGGWQSCGYPQMRFEVHNVDCYPTDLEGAVQHNAWWDAMALRHKLASCDTHPKDGDVKQAPLVSGAVPNEDSGDAQTPSPSPTERPGRRTESRPGDTGE